MKDNKLGKKIKELRKQKKMTQAELVGTRITRNMLSSIESGNANPSLDTLEYIAERLDTSVAHLISDDSLDLAFLKKEKIDAIYRSFNGKSYDACIRIIKSLPSLDDELSFIIGSAYLELGSKNVAAGSLVSAEKNIKEALVHLGNTRLGTNGLLARCKMLLSITKNVQSPLLEFDKTEYLDGINATADFELFKFITRDYDYQFSSLAFSLHAEAKKLIKERNYIDAAAKLLSAADKVKEEGYNAFVLFSIYADLENCYKQLYDYEKAYLYSNKRLTMLDGFKA